MKLPRLARNDLSILSVLLLLALVAALVTWLLTPPERTGGLWGEPSTFYNAGYGTKAAYRVLDRLDYRVQRLRRPMTPSNLERLAGLFVLNPVVGLSDSEMDVLVNWVERGGRLVVAPGPSDMAMQAGSSFGEWFEMTEAGGAAPPVGPRPLTPLGNPDPTATGFDARDPLCEGVSKLAAGEGRRFVEGKSVLGDFDAAGVHEFWKDDSGIVALRIEHGAGEIVALADPHSLTNLGIGEADNAVFLANLSRRLAGADRGTIAFDEYHLGKPLRDVSWVAMAKLMFSGNWRWAVLQAALLGALALWAAAVRFGTPRDLQHRRRWQHQEFTEAAGRLLYASGATPIAQQTLYHHYRNRLCRLVHRSPETTNAELAEAVRRAGGGQIGALLDEIERRGTRRVSQQQLLQMCQTLHRAVEALEHHDSASRADRSATDEDGGG
jgi:hypothetical protein